MNLVSVIRLDLVLRVIVAWMEIVVYPALRVREVPQVFQAQVSQVNLVIKAQQVCLVHQEGQDYQVSGLD